MKLKISLTIISLLLCLMAWIGLDFYQKNQDDLTIDAFTYHIQNIPYNIKQVWYGRKIRGYWKVYDIRTKSEYCYFYGKESIYFIKRNSLEPCKKVAYQCDVNDKGEDIIWALICEPISIPYKIINDSIFFHDKKKITDKGIRISEEEYKNWCNFSSNSVNINPVIGEGEQKFDPENEQNEVIYVGKPSLNKKDSLIGFFYGEQIANATDLKERIKAEIEPYKSELLLNADKDAPVSLLDSIKTMVKRDFPTLKFYQVLWNDKRKQVEKRKL